MFSFGKKIFNKRENFEPSQLLAILENVLEGIYALDLDLNYTYVNPAYCKITQYSIEELIGQNWPHSIIIQGDRTKALDAHREMLAKGFAETKLVAQRKDGSKFYKQLKIIRRTNQLNQLVGSYCLIGDVSYEMKISELEALANSIPQMAWVNLPDGKVIYLNKVWSDYTGLDFDQLIKADWTKLIHPEECVNTFRLWDYSLKSGLAFERTHRILSKTGNYRWFLVRAHPVMDASGVIVKWFGTATDVDDIMSDKKGIFE